MITVRQIAVDDIELVFPLARQMHEALAAKCPEFALDFDEDAGREYFAEMADNVFIALAEQDGQPFGFVVAHAGRRTFSSEVYVSPKLFHVVPGNRIHLAALMLAQSVEAWGQSFSAELAFEPDFIAVNPDVIEQTYGARGYSCMGGTYVKKVQSPEETSSSDGLTVDI